MSKQAAPFQIALITDSLRLPWREAILKAKAMGVDGFQIYAVKGEISPEGLDGAARGALRAFVAAQGLEITALCGDLGGHGFAIPEENPGKIEASKRIVDLAVDLGTRVVTTHIGVVPEDRRLPRYQVLLAACRELGAYAGKRGVSFAIETGPETAAVPGAFLDEVATPGIGVNLDPANLAMVTGDDPVAAVTRLRSYIVHTHAKDGVKLGPCDPEQVYDAFARGGIEGFDFGKLFNETPLGQGAVDWPRYLRALSGIGYRGALTIEREVGADPARDISAAISFLREKMGELG
ncbi:MAG: sugar phosphate isomerase/epimerase [Spirochaetes bacterium]|nr:sugar phosphate isomerase/epimerase [Spirochaetota bacterium]